MKNKHTENSLSNNKLLEPPSHLYRFRKLCHVFDKKELENQEIYFSTPEKLNDPLEGSIDLFWRGDEIAWKGFFKHYIVVLMQWEIFEIVVGNSSNTVLSTDQLWHNVHQLPTQKYKDKVFSIYSKFFSHPNIKELISVLGNMNRNIKKLELQFYLITTLRFILDLISVSNGFKDNYNDKVIKILTPSFFNNMKKRENEELIKFVFDIGSSFLDEEQVALYAALEHYDITQKHKTKINSIMRINNYFSVLESLVLPYWCTSSFTQHCNNASLWGHYSDGHKGICLKFKTQKNGNEDIGIPVTNSVYFENQTESVISFTKILYQTKYPEYDFFRLIAKLNSSSLIDYFSDEEGNKSLSTNFIENETLWREYYWKEFHKKISIKSKEWEYEKEYRLMMSSFLSDIQNKNNRKFKYNFSSLEGIIFGIKTPSEDKLEIIKIIYDKCKRKSRTDFKFYQAYYDSNTGRIENKEMEELNSRIFSDIKNKI